MPKNLKGGNKSKTYKNSTDNKKNREIPFPDLSDDSHVGIITKVNGDSRYLCQIVNSNGVQPTIYPVNLSRGTKDKYGKYIIVGVGTYILFAIREFQKDKGDIIFIYRDNEIQYLLNNNYIKLINKNNEEENEDILFTDINDNEINDNEINNI
jgi:hypothetical protein